MQEVNFSKRSIKRVLNYFNHGKERYKSFRKERLHGKFRAHNDTITKVNLPKLEQKPAKSKTAIQIEKHTSKEVGNVTRKIDIARARGIFSVTIILTTTCYLMEN